MILMFAWTSRLHLLGVGEEVERSQLFLPAGSLTQPLQLSCPHLSWDSGCPLLTNISSSPIVHAHPILANEYYLPCRATLPQDTSLNVVAIFFLKTFLFLRTKFPLPTDSPYGTQQNFPLQPLKRPNCIIFQHRCIFLPCPEQSAGKNNITTVVHYGNYP